VFGVLVLGLLTFEPPLRVVVSVGVKRALVTLGFPPEAVTLKIGLDMLAIAVLDQVSGEVVGVGLYSAIKTFFFDQESFLGVPELPSHYCILNG